MIELIVVCMTSSGMTSCMTSLGPTVQSDVTSPVTRSVTTTLSHVVKGRKIVDFSVTKTTESILLRSPPTTSGVQEFSEHGVRGSRVKNSLEKSQNKRNSTGHRSNHNVPMKNRRQFAGTGGSDPPQLENFQNFGSACTFSRTNPTASEP